MDKIFGTDSNFHEISFSTPPSPHLQCWKRWKWLWKHVRLAQKFNIQNNIVNGGRGLFQYIMSMIVWEKFSTEIVYILKISIKSVFLCTVTCQQDLITLLLWSCETGELGGSCETGELGRILRNRRAGGILRNGRAGDIVRNGRISRGCVCVCVQCTGVHCYKR